MTNLIICFSIFGVLSYFIGAIPFGFIIAKQQGIDIRKHGSGNIGATNVVRSVGKKFGILTFFCDALKGFIPVFLFPLAATKFGWNCNNQLLAIICMLLAIAGHNWPVYLKFKGGKGMATGTGCLLALAPVPLSIGLALWAVIFYSTRYVSVASIAAALAVSAAAWSLNNSEDLTIPVILTFLSLVVIVRHKTNIKRLIKGTENKFAKKVRNNK
jgi:acyl phosphate:glycerol-3-phosphate acyltransferase